MPEHLQPGFWRVAGLVIGKDLRIERRSM